MKKITPFDSFNEAKSSLDNGGRFYNLLTKANDGVVSTAELAKVAGVFNDKQAMVLYLEMSIQDLKENDKKDIYNSLSDSLISALSKFKPQRLLPSEALESGVLASNAIITGIPKLVDSKSEFTGFIMIPIQAGKVMTMMMIPIMDQYDVYELRDENSNQEFLIAHARGKEKLPENKIICGGILKEINEKEEGDKKPKIFLECSYFSSFRL